MTVLVTGGAGYIGAHVTVELAAAGRRVVVVDDLSTGSSTRVPDGVPLVRADVRDTAALRSVITRHGVSGIVHLAARKDVAESTAYPLRYYAGNVNGDRSVLTAAIDARVGYVVYSSSAAVYGAAAHRPVTEAAPTEPANAYGRTKLVGEWMLADAAAAGGPRFVALRYFNVAGAGRAWLGDPGRVNLLQRLLHAAAGGGRATVYGGDHDTRDGSCERDYVHVADVAGAHARAVEALAAGEVTGEVLNVGRGTGTTVLEMVRAVRALTGCALPADIVGRRLGDPASVVASADLIAGRLGWTARFGLDDIVSSAWAALPRAGAAEAA
ncbi:UDP-glucose 4-epimerase GalE [Amycolatopsis suaedae]|uniref:UDP-glucose 4-epimerase n=1 Tax=Amycolatopsis suaedae TaxID=2510978 RepID=A0A4Q7J4X9_9PSEU|nr:UDP-glucose 4-epimerase GalE [Amycolatopsis suaedae]RZQ61084.1 UDP-glucose 4-epimerase GalE [Amycolatopsis suaedae]